jgi:hypothetical protein
MHYNYERPHQALGNHPITPRSAPLDISKPIIRIEHQGGLIHLYRRAA